MIKLKVYPVDILPMIRKYIVNTDEILRCAIWQGFHGHIVWKRDKKFYKNGKIRWVKTAQIDSFIIEKQGKFITIPNLYQVRTF